jgi:hypothetical protein
MAAVLLDKVSAGTADTNDTKAAADTATIAVFILRSSLVLALRPRAANKISPLREGAASRCGESEDVVQAS